MKGIFTGGSFEDEVASRLQWLGEGELVKNVFIYSYNLGKYTEIDAIYVTPYKIYCIESKSFRTSLTGNINDSTWIGKSGKYIKRIYNPYFQNIEHVRCIKRRLREFGLYTNRIESIIVLRDSCEIVSDYENAIPLRRLVSKIKRECMKSKEQILDVNQIKLSLLKLEE